MSTSGVNNIVYTRDDIITEALEICGALTVGETPTSAHLTSCARTLNMLIDLWQTDGLQLYRRKQYSCALTAGDSSYKFGTGGELGTEIPTRILAAWRRSNDAVPIDTTLSLMAQTDYMGLSSKSTQGTIVSYYYDYLGTSGNVIVWPAPAVGVTDTLYVYGERPIYNVSAASDDVDVPNYYFMALSWGLAAALGTKYGTDATTLGYINNQAMLYKMEAITYDIEYNTSIEIKPSRQGK